MIKNRVLLYVLLCFCVICLSGCSFMDEETKSENETQIRLSLEEETSSEEESEMDLSQGDLYMMFEEMNNEEIAHFLYDDYNKDGIHEAFVLTKEANFYKLWCISPSDCRIVCENLENIDAPNTEILSYDTKAYLLLQQFVEGVNNTLVYTLNNDNQVIPVSISDKGYIHMDSEKNIILDVYEKKDVKNKTDKKSYISYYLYYVLEDGFREYGAIPIGEEQFLEFEGSQEILNRVYDEYGENVFDINFLYRANNYINVNLSIYENGEIVYRNIALYYDDKAVSYVTEEIADGKAEVANMLSIATFPTAFKHPHNNDNR